MQNLLRRDRLSKLLFNDDFDDNHNDNNHDDDNDNNHRNYNNRSK